MRALLWPYYAPEEVAAARIYRLRTHDFRTPLVAAHLVTQWRLKRRGGPGPLPCGQARGWHPVPGKYGKEVSFRASLHRLLHE